MEQSAEIEGIGWSGIGKNGMERGDGVKFGIRAELGNECPLTSCNNS